MATSLNPSKYTFYSSCTLPRAKTRLKFHFDKITAKWNRMHVGLYMDNSLYEYDFGEHRFITRYIGKEGKGSLFKRHFNQAESLTKDSGNNIFDHLLIDKTHIDCNCTRVFHWSFACTWLQTRIRLAALKGVSAESRLNFVGQHWDSLSHRSAVDSSTGERRDMNTRNKSDNKPIYRPQRKRPVILINSRVRKGKYRI